MDKRSETHGSRKNKIKKEKRVGSILLVVAFVIFLGISFYITNKDSKSSEQSEEPEQIEEEVVIEEVIEEKKVLGQSFISVYVGNEEIDGSPVQVDVYEDIELMDYMIENFEIGRNAEGIITSIDGNKQNEDEERSWMYYINGYVGEVDADEYILKDDAMIEWKLEKIK